MKKLRREINEVLRLQVGAVASEKTENCYQIEPYWRGSLTTKIIEAFKAHIEGVEKPENLFTEAHAHYCCNTGMIAMRDTLMEAL